MATPKTILTLCMMLFSLIMTSQSLVLQGSTYIGKTKNEIKKLNEANNSKLIKNQKEGPIFSIIYYDSLNTLTNHFFFARKGPFGIGRWKCMIYLANVDYKSQFEKVKADVQAKSAEKMSDKRLVQVPGTKKYDWIFTSSEESNLHSVIVQKHHHKLNNR